MPAPSGMELFSFERRGKLWPSVLIYGDSDSGQVKTFSRYPLSASVVEILPPRWYPVESISLEAVATPPLTVNLYADSSISAVL